MTRLVDDELLVDWLLSQNNPLTARVMVNRIWQHHFGRGIVPTPNDFGKQGKPATHPELLDYLAAKFVSDGWSIKSMHRLILLSRTYQLSSHARAESAAEKDAVEFAAEFLSAPAARCRVDSRYAAHARRITRVSAPAGPSVSAAKGLEIYAAQSFQSGI